jgi:hypothetical protein
MNNERGVGPERRDLILSTGIIKILLTRALLVSTLQNTPHSLQLTNKFELENYKFPPTDYAF